MDLQKFIFRQRLQTTAVLALLKGRQAAIVDKMSELVLSSTSDRICGSSDDELNLITQQAFNTSIKKLIKSTDKTDKRIVDQYMIRQAHKRGIPLDFKVDTEDYSPLPKQEEIKF